MNRNEMPQQLTNVAEKAKEFYNTFKTVLQVNDMRAEANPFVKECAKACCDKLCNEVTGNKDKYDYYKAVRNAIDVL
jgi:hypothetical protein